MRKSALQVDNGAGQCRVSLSVELPEPLRVLQTCCSSCVSRVWAIGTLTLVPVFQQSSAGRQVSRPQGFVSTTYWLESGRDLTSRFLPLLTNTFQIDTAVLAEL